MSKKTKMEKVFNLLDKTILKLACRTQKEREQMMRYLLANLATL